MRKILLVFAISAFSLMCFAGEILIKQLDYATELYIKEDKVEILSSQLNDKNATITFNKNIDINVEKLSDIFIKNMTSDKNKLYISLKMPASLDTAKVSDGVKIIFSKKIINNNANVKNVIESPKAITGKKILKDPQAESDILKIKNAINNEDYQNAILQINDFLSKHGDDIYGQEAYYLLGIAYMGLGKISDKNYVQASAIFEDFAKRFTNSYLYIDALWNSATAKEKAGLYYEAIFEYRNIISAMPETDIARKAYEKIGLIYENIGQFDKAIESYKEMLSIFKIDNVKFYAKIGMLYSQLKDINAAYEYFSKIIDKDIEYNELGEDILFSLAEILEKKEFYNRAIDVYEKIYNLFPDGKFADLAMYNAAKIFEKTGKDKIADQLYLDTKNKYYNKKGGLLAALRYADKYLDKNITDYWVEFLNYVINTDIDVNIRAEGYLLIIRSYFREKIFDKTLEYIKIFETNFFDSPYLQQVYEIKQKIYMENAKNFFMQNDLKMAKAEIDKLLTEFPDTKFKDEIGKILEYIKFTEINSLLEQKKYLDAIKSSEEYLASRTSSTDIKRWKKLLDKAYYEYILSLENSGNFDASELFTKEYFINIREGESSKKLQDILNRNLVRKFSKLAEDRNYIDILKSYNDNKSWIKYLYQDAKESIFSYVAYAYYSLGEIKRAKDIITQIKDVKNNEVFIIKLLLNEDTFNYDINKLNQEQLQFLAKEFYKNDPKRGFNELKKYKQDYKLSVMLRNILTEKITDDAILKDFYTEIFKFNISEDNELSRILFKAGVYYFNNKNYLQARSFFEKLFNLNNIDNKIKGDAAFYLGKIALNEGNNDEAIKYFQNVADNFKESEYYDKATVELRDLNWKKKLRSQ
jgi:tetratricopeptide (TPR) repeat protein